MGATNPPEANSNTDSFQWDMYGKHVQPDVNEYSFIASRSILIMVPLMEVESRWVITMHADQATRFQPIGLVQDLNLAQNKQLEQIFEIGSARTYFAPGHMSRTISMRRVLFNGKNILRLLTPDPGLNAQVEGYRRAGAEGSDFYINLGSPLFDRPLTICLLLSSASGITKQAGSEVSFGAQNPAVTAFTDIYGAVALEYGYIQTHNMSITGGTTVISENVDIMFDRMFPLQVKVA